MATATEVLLNSLRRLQNSHEYSDLKIFCGDEVFRVHRAIICPRSKYFGISCKWGKEGQLREEITLEDESPRLISLMIDYLYQLDYDDLPPSKPAIETPPPAPESPVAKNLKFFETLGHDAAPPEVPEAMEPHATESEPLEAAADSWGFGRLSTSKKDKKKKKKPARASLEDTGTAVDTARLTTNALMYALTDKYDIGDLKILAAAKFADAVHQDWRSNAFVHAAELVFSTTPSSDRGLRKVVINTLNEHQELLDYEEVQALLDSGNGMAWAFVQLLVGRGY